MKSKIFWLILPLLVSILGFSVVASAQMLIPASDQGREKARAENSPVIERAGNHLVLTPPGLEKVFFVHHQKDFAKPPWAGGGKDKKGSKCYAFLGKGVEWKELPVNYVTDPDNSDGLTEAFVTEAISQGAEEWDRHTSAELFGSYSVDYNASWDSLLPDGRNELLFGDYPEEGVIGIAIVWGYFSGPPNTRAIIEFDILFDSDFAWGDATTIPAVMDLQNIATHEIGHGVGLADLYKFACLDETMYGFSDYGEIEKRDLNEGDIAGIQKLYGI